MKHYRIRNPRTRLLLAGFTPAGEPCWTALRDQAEVFTTRPAAEAARARLQAFVRPPAARRNIFADVNVILQRQPHVAVQILVQHKTMRLTEACQYVLARRADWLAGRLRAAGRA